jgi:secreted PhoX family phosphatase
MCVSGKNLARHTARVGLAVLCAGVLLTACKHSNNHTISKGLWVANGTTVLEFTATQLNAGGVTNVAPHITTTGNGTLGGPQGVTFDSAGNLWVMDTAAVVNGNTTPALVKFSAMQVTAMAKTPNPTPEAVITSASFAFPQQSVFDKAGNQWVSDHNNNTVLVFTAGQLAMTGTNELVPVVVLSSAAFNGPLGIVFDSAGNLWVANNGAVPGANGAAASADGTTIVEFSAAHLPTVPTSGMLTPDLTPDITLSDDGNGSIQQPWELQFDSGGNLWSSNSNNPNTLVQFAKANLMATGAPTPMTTISPATVMGNATLVAPNGLCLDNLGDLASNSSATPFSVTFFKTPLKTGALTPSTFIIGSNTTLNAPAGCNFGPLVN